MLAAEAILAAGCTYTEGHLASYTKQIEQRFGVRADARSQPFSLPAGVAAVVSRALLGIAWRTRRILLEEGFLHSLRAEITVTRTAVSVARNVGRRRRVVDAGNTSALPPTRRQDVAAVKRSSRHQLRDHHAITAARLLVAAMRSGYRPQAAWPTMYQRTMTLNGTPRSHATM